MALLNETNLTININVYIHNVDSEIEELKEFLNFIKSLEKDDKISSKIDDIIKEIKKSIHDILIKKKNNHITLIIVKVGRAFIKIV